MAEKCFCNENENATFKLTDFGRRVDLVDVVNIVPLKSYIIITVVVV